MSIPQVAAHLLTTLYTVANLGNSVNPAVPPKEVNLHTDTNSNSITRVVTSPQLQTPSKEQRFEFQQAQVEGQPQVIGVISIIACIEDDKEQILFDKLLSDTNLNIYTIKQAMDKLRENGIKARLNLDFDGPFSCSESEGTPKKGTVVILRTQSI